MPSITSLFQPSTVPSRQYGDDHFRYQNTGSSDSHTQTDPYALPSAAADQRYPYATTPPDGTWHPGPFSNSRTLGDAHPSLSPSSSDSPSLSPNVHYLSRFPIPDDNRVSVVNVTMPGHAYGKRTSFSRDMFVPDIYTPKTPARL